MDSETTALVQRWILTFCETPVLIDADLMRRVLDEAEAVPPSQVLPGAGRLQADA